MLAGAILAYFVAGMALAPQLSQAQPAPAVTHAVLGVSPMGLDGGLGMPDAGGMGPRY